MQTVLKNHVLVVDDEEGVLLLLRRILEGAGHTVQTATDAHDALAKIAEAPPAVALCDIHMPGPSGLWLTEQIRQVSPHTAMILATSDSEVPASESLRTGIVAYVLKPFDSEEVLGSVAQAYAWWSDASNEPVPVLTPKARRLSSAVAAVTAPYRPPPTASAMPPVAKSGAGRRVAPWLSVGAVVLLVAGAAGWLWWSRRPQALLARVTAASGAILVMDGQGTTVAQGSGFFVGPEVFVTDHHVVSGGLEARVEVGRRVFRVVGVVGLDRQHDVALLRTAPSTEAFLTLATTLPKLGAPITVYGAPTGFAGTLSTGIVSAERVDGEAPLQISAPISAGSSGSPVIDEDGLVVGMVTASAALAQNVNFAVPASRVQDLLRRTGEVRPLLVAARGAGDDRERHELVGPVRLVTISPVAVPRQTARAARAPVPDARRELVFDRAGRLIEERQGTLVTQYQYAGNGRLLSERFLDGGVAVETWTYRASGSAAVVSEVDAAGRSRRIEYLPDGRVSVRQQLLGDAVVASVRWTYDERAWPSASGALEPAVREEHDAIGNPTLRVYADGTEIRFTYRTDKRGNWVTRERTRRDALGMVSAPEKELRTIAYWD